MIEDEDDGRVARDVFETSHLDALEINPERKPHDGNYKVTYAFVHLCGIKKLMQ